MRTCLAVVLMSGLAAFGQQKVATVQMQSAIVGTKEGQKAVSDLESRVAPKRKELEAMQAEIRKLQTTLQNAVLNEQGALNLRKQIEPKSKAYQRALEDAQAQFQGEQDRLMNELGGKLIAVIAKYAKDNKFSLVIDVSNPRTPVMYASDGIDITKAVVSLYDQSTALAKPAPAAATKALPPGK